MSANYSATQSKTSTGLETVRLQDAAHHTEVTVLVSVGNMAVDMKVNGTPIFWTPYKTVEEQKARPVMLGNPFLAPWANRLDHEGFYANGHHYKLNPEIKNYHNDGNGQPIHGLITFTDRWVLTEAESNGTEAWCTSKLEFWKYPDLMAQWPFAHSIEMTYKLHDGAMEVVTTLRNLSSEPMPVAIGYHPYFQISDAPRDEWTVTLPVKDRVVLSPKLVPTGDRQPSPYAVPFVLKGVQLDDVFTSMTGREFSVSGKAQKITVEYGPNYPVAVVYAPPGRNFICFEPMTGVTNAINLAQAGVHYNELQSVPAGGTWTASYWIRPSGF